MVNQQRKKRSVMHEKRSVGIREIGIGIRLTERSWEWIPETY